SPSSCERGVATGLTMDSRCNEWLVVDRLDRSVMQHLHHEAGTGAAAGQGLQHELAKLVLGQHAHVVGAIGAGAAGTVADSDLVIGHAEQGHPTTVTAHHAV